MPSWNDGQSMSSGRRRGHYDMTIETWRASIIIAAPAEAVYCRPRRPPDPPGHRRHRLGQQGTRQHATHSIRPDVPDGDVARQRSEPQLRDDQPSGHFRSAASDLLDAGHHIAGDGTPQFGGWIGATIWSPPNRPALRSRSPTTGPRYRRSSANTSRTRRSSWTTSPTRGATWPSWSNRPQPTAFRHAVAERMGNRRPPGHRSMPSRAPERKESQ